MRSNIPIMRRVYAIIYQRQHDLIRPPEQLKAGQAYWIHAPVETRVVLR